MPFYDINFTGGNGYSFVNTLPEYLRPRLGGVSAEQCQVYEAFPSAPHTVVPGGGAAANGNFGYQSPDLRQSGSIAPSPTTGMVELPLDQAAKRMDQFVVDLINALSALQGVRSLSDLNQDHVVVRMFSRVPSILMSTPNKYELAAYTAQIVFPKLFERMLLHREAFLTIVDALVSAVPAIRPKITELLIFSEPAQKFHHEVVPALLHYNMLSIADYDAELADMMAQRHPIAIEFANFLYQNMIKAMALNASDLILTLEMLLRLSPADVELRGLVESVRGTQYADQYQGAEYAGIPAAQQQQAQAQAQPQQAQPPSAHAAPYPPSAVAATATTTAATAATAATTVTGVYPEGKPPMAQQQQQQASVRYDSEVYHRVIPAQLERQVVMLFDEWLNIYKINDVKTILNFMRHLQQTLGFYSTKEISDVDIAVYQVCIETAIYKCLVSPAQSELDAEDNLRTTSDAVGISGMGAGVSGGNGRDMSPLAEGTLNYRSIEAAAKLLFHMVRYAPDKISALNIVLNVIGRVMHSNYQSEYDQRPYFKLFACLLLEFNVLDPVLEQFYLDIFLEVCHVIFFLLLLALHQ